MIGIAASKDEAQVVEEFFQLFKVPWEFCQDDKRYDVVIVSQERQAEKIMADVFFIFSSKITKFDRKMNIFLSKKLEKTILRIEGLELPIYGYLSTFKPVSSSLRYLKSGANIIGLKIKKQNRTFFRIGYNLFEEIRTLLQRGQPAARAFIPAVENHIALLKKWLIEAGIPFLEIPPIPYGYDYITCLTHDVDFVKIRNHIFDRSILGFIYRGLIGSLNKLLAGSMSFSRFLNNWKATFSLPFVFLGVIKDFWFQFYRYSDIEKSLKSTYFFIPFQNKPGEKISGNKAHRRAAKYDVSQIKGLIDCLKREGNEIAVHGIDAWHSVSSGDQERKRISEITGDSDLGIRMHWLLSDEQTFQKIEKAGYLWDSSSGYNQAVGFRAGTSQVFRPLGTESLLEIPLHIQDTALFSGRRMDLSEAEAWPLCQKIIKTFSRSGGVLTVVWHQRSLGPERLWDNFYQKLLTEIRLNRVWFGTAGMVVGWFRKRRRIRFDEVKICGRTFKLKLSGAESDSLPPLMIRVHYPENRKSKPVSHSSLSPDYKDIPLTSQTVMDITF